MFYREESHGFYYLLLSHHEWMLIREKLLVLLQSWLLLKLCRVHLEVLLWTRL